MGSSDNNRSNTSNHLRSTIQELPLTNMSLANANGRARQSDILPNYSDLNIRVDLVKVALKQAHFMDLCPLCQGPRVYSRETRDARCFKCLELFHNARGEKHRCAECRIQFRVVGIMNTKYCKKCQQKRKEPESGLLPPSEAISRENKLQIASNSDDI